MRRSCAGSNCRPSFNKKEPYEPDCVGHVGEMVALVGVSHAAAQSR